MATKGFYRQGGKGELVKRSQAFQVASSLRLDLRMLCDLFLHKMNCACQCLGYHHAGFLERHDLALELK